MSPANNPFLNGKSAAILAIVAVAAFHVAYSISSCSFLVAVFLFCLFRLTHLRTPRQAVYTGLAVGMALYAPQLGFFWSVFGAAAIALWVILAFWLAMFLVLGRACLVRFGPILFACLAPFLWTGLEYFRSELYFLRFSWLNVGYVFSNTDELRALSTFGVYGIGFLIMAAASIFYLMPAMGKRTRIAVIILMGGTLIYPTLHLPKKEADKGVKVAGMQLEFPSEPQVKVALDDLNKASPEAELLVLSEYTFADGPIPERIRNWCRDHKKFLVVGGKDPVSTNQFYNTVFVVGPDGEIVFRQAKSVPIQFFKDGLPAKDQALWNSPWGLIGFAICYDASFTRVTDRLIRMGAQAIIQPTMDVADWGQHEHDLHARIVPMRAAEYRIPIFRLASSGISQLAQPDGTVQTSAPFPGERCIIQGTLGLVNRGRLPWDRYIAPVSVVLVASLVTWLAAAAWVARQKQAQRKR